MRKVIVINGLARGGTNLAANLLAAQYGWHVSDAAIAEITCIDQFLPRDFANHYTKTLGYSEVKRIIEGSLDKFKTRSVDGLVKTICPSYHTIKTKYHAGILGYYGVPIDVWGKYMRDIAGIQGADDLDNLYQDLAEVIGCTALAHRTTALTSYARSFLSRSNNHYWIEIVRDPFDRAVSSRKGHAQCLTQSFLQSKWQRDQIGKIVSDNFILIRYEDVCSDPRGSVENICNRIGINCQSFNPLPVTPDMSCFSGNSSNNPDIFNQVKTDIPIYQDSIGTGNVLTKRERLLGDSILSGRKTLIGYFIILALADAVFLLGSAIQKFSATLLSVNYISVMRQFGWRKVLQRCMGRF